MRIQCKQCGQALLVRGPAKEIDDLFANNPDRDSIYNCPWCTGAVGYHSPEVEDAASTNARVVTPHEAHMMLSQLGREESVSARPPEYEICSSRARCPRWMCRTSRAPRIANSGALPSRTEVGSTSHLVALVSPFTP